MRGQQWTEISRRDSSVFQPELKKKTDSIVGQGTVKKAASCSSHHLECCMRTYDQKKKSSCPYLPCNADGKFCKAHEKSMQTKIFCPTELPLYAGYRKAQFSDLIFLHRTSTLSCMFTDVTGASQAEKCRAVGWQPALR